jgi:flagellar biosynthesis protein FlhA
MANIINLKLIKHLNFGLVFGIMIMFAMVVLPIPPFLLDLIFSFNISISIVILIVCVNVIRPLEFSVFPSILLITTLLRLTLNIASTRVVLLNGHMGSDAAGKVIKSFGEVVIGSNLVVGIIVFAILMIINFVVITKGAGRISEVSARFILDAMPGKQMAVDADLNAGLLSQDEAKKRRQEIIQEADFYGSMDGASKFIRGDAVAGILILFINLIGGIVIGTIEFNMSLSGAIHTFSLLTIGDGLVAQIPSLLLSISAAIMVTRVNTESNMGEQTMSQLFGNPKPLFITSAILFIMALMPDMPHVPFILIAIVSLTTGYLIKANKLAKLKTVNLPLHQPNKALPAGESAELGWDQVVSSDNLGLEIGYGLIALVNVNKDGPLINRIKSIRKRLSLELGFLIPAIHVKDNMSINLNHYRIFLKNVVISEGEVYLDKLLAINPGNVKQPLNGLSCKDPTFGMDAYWVAHGQKNQAQDAGYTVVDPLTVITTHLNHVAKINAYHLLGYDEVQQLLNRLSMTTPKLVETLTSQVTGLPLSIIVTVLQRLLQSDIPIIDMRTIAEKMIEVWSRNKDVDTLVDGIRIALKKLIIYSIYPNKNDLPVGVLDNDLAQILHRSIQSNQVTGEKLMLIEPSLTERIYGKLLEFVQKCEVESKPAVLLVTTELRGLMEKLFKSSIPTIHFLSHNEVPDDRQLNVIAKIG